METAVLVSVIIVVVLVVLLGLFLLASYQSLNALRTRVDEAWADIAAQMRRRAELVPPVVRAIGGAAPQERAALTAVNGARDEVLASSSPTDASVAETHLSNALRQALALADGYPGLATNPEFLQMQTELGDAEDKLQASRRFYNGGVRELNTKMQGVPYRMFARRMHLQRRDFFEAVEGGSKAAPPRIQF